jgi:hypothetical protein
MVRQKLLREFRDVISILQENEWSRPLHPPGYDPIAADILLWQTRVNVLVADCGRFINDVGSPVQRERFQNNKLVNSLQLDRERESPYYARSARRSESYFRDESLADLGSLVSLIKEVENGPPLRGLEKQSFQFLLKKARGEDIQEKAAADITEILRSYRLTAFFRPGP